MTILMAAKKTTKSKTKKRYPIQNVATVRHVLTQLSNNGIIFTDRVLSRLNKRLYRQGRFYQVKVDLDLQQAPAGVLEVYALRDTWGNQKAYQMAYDMFMSATEAERARIGKSAIARWQDFRCENGTGYNEMYPAAYDHTQAESLLQTGEFSNTEVQDISGNTMQFTWGNGVSGSRYGIRGEYENKANTDDSPTTNAEDVPYDTLQENISNVEIDQLRNRGNDPPYAGDSFGDAWVKVATLSNTAGQQRLTTGFFTAPCGFIVITGLNPAGSGTPLTLEVKSGDYKGVMAPSMLEV